MRKKVFLLSIALALVSATTDVRADSNPAPQSGGVIGNFVVGATGTAATLIARNINRTYLLIQNQGNSSVVIKADSTIAASEGFWLAPQALWEPHPPLVDAFFVKAPFSGSTQNVWVIEGVK